MLAYDALWHLEGHTHINEPCKWLEGTPQKLFLGISYTRNLFNRMKIEANEITVGEMGKFVELPFTPFPHGQTTYNVTLEGNRGKDKEVSEKKNIPKQIIFLSLKWK